MGASGAHAWRRMRAGLQQRADFGRSCRRRSWSWCKRCVRDRGSGRGAAYNICSIYAELSFDDRVYGYFDARDAASEPDDTTRGVYGGAAGRALCGSAWRLPVVELCGWQMGGITSEIATRAPVRAGRARLSEHIAHDECTSEVNRENRCGAFIVSLARPFSATQSRAQIREASEIPCWIARFASSSEATSAPPMT